jgi:hypothetical protein
MIEIGDNLAELIFGIAAMITIVALIWIGTR